MKFLRIGLVALVLFLTSCSKEETIVTVKGDSVFHCEVCHYPNGDYTQEPIRTTYTTFEGWYLNGKPGKFIYAWGGEDFKSGKAVLMNFDSEAKKRGMMEEIIPDSANEFTDVIERPEN